MSIEGLEILIVDDSSPDGTADIVHQEAHQPGLPIHLLLRRVKEGLGRAYVAGFRWALAREFDYVVSMDADFSHGPHELPKLLMASAQYDVVIGSRYVPGGQVIGRLWQRHLISRIANWVTRRALGLEPQDVTAGYKRYSRRFLKSLDFNEVTSSGYAFQVEMVLRAQKQNFQVTEVPITFVERQAGQSKACGELKRSVQSVYRLMMRCHSKETVPKTASYRIGG